MYPLMPGMLAGCGRLEWAQGLCHCSAVRRALECLKGLDPDSQDRSALQHHHRALGAAGCA